MSFDSKTAITVGSSVVIGFAGDLLIYSLSESKGKRFGLHVPKGWALVNLVALGVATGLVIDFTLRQIEVAIMNKQEKELNDLVEKEKIRIAKGEVDHKEPKQVIWG